MNYTERGRECILYGKKAKDMTIEELLFFVGILDETVEESRDAMRHLLKFNEYVSKFSITRA